MGLTDALGTWWPLAALLAAFGSVSLAFTRCAVAEGVVRLAARLYAGSPAERERWREEWLRNVEDLHPARRPSEAGSLLWIGVREATIRQISRRRSEPALRVERDLPERYSLWLQQLSSEDGAVRLGGIRALKRFSLDAAVHTDRIDWRVALGALAALARNLSKETERPLRVANIAAHREEHLSSRRAVGVAEAVQVLGRFPQLSGRWKTLEHDLTGAALAGADLSRLDLPRVNLSRADLRGANIRHAGLRSANLAGADLVGSDLRGASLRDVCLRGACLRGANLGCTSLRGADLSHADLRGARLTHAHLSGVTLRGADLRGADLTGVNLEFVDLVRLDQRVDLPHAWLVGVMYDETTVWPKGFEPPLTDNRPAGPDIVTAARRDPWTAHHH